MPKYRVPGRRDPEAERGRRGFLGVTAETVLATRVEAGRGAEQGTERVDPDDGQVVKIVLQDNITLWTSVAAAREDFGIDTGTRGEVGNDLIPSVLAIGRAERGGGWLVKALEFINVDIAVEVENAVASKLVANLEEKFEGLVGIPGLFCLAADGTVDRGEKITASEKPYLVFVHGTASSTSGGFGQLFLQADWPDVYKHYDKRVLAFEHRTLSKNPIENALELVNELPVGATIDFVSHSRGGLVCELVCRAMRVAAIGEIFEPFDATDRMIIEKSRSSSNQVDTGTKELALLDKLGTALKDRKLRVRQLVRVACPARGTTLASRRLDRYLSLMVNLIALVPGLAGNPVYDLTMGLLLVAAKKRTDPTEIPGLEAQMPELPLVAMVNRLDVVLSGKLSVVSGDIVGTGILGRLKTLATDLFYREDHDLVVNTDAMYGGAQRQPEAMFLFDRGGEVNHFSYFMNPFTAGAITGAVREKSLGELGFKPLSDRNALRRVARVRAAPSGQQPTVFVLPGTMGSQLRRDKNQIWLDIPEIARGGIEKIKWGEPKVAPDGVFDKYYGGLVDFLSDSHTVIPFDYDWRKSILEEGNRLAAKVEERLKNSNQPIRFIAHSMGGLVVRAMAVQHPGVWNKIRLNPGSRFVMLGTPNLGSFSIVSTLLGRDKMIRQLAMLDFTHDVRELLEFIACYPGVLELLPRDQAGSFYTSEMWKKLRGIDVDKWVVPEKTALAAAATSWAKIDTFMFSGDGMAYVAGFDSEPTAVGVKVEEDGKKKQRVTILGTRQGDGRVPWASGIPQGVPVWYAECVHGDLARYEEAFAAYGELLKTGTTSGLKKEPPVAARGISEALVEMKPDSGDMYPSTDEAVDSIMGGRRRKLAERGKAKVQVTVYHGDLRFASDPIVVGHYLHDTLSGPEKVLDHTLSERLSKMRARGVYPGEVGTAEVVLRSSSKPPGAIVIGLGRFGDLNSGSLSDAYSYGLRKFVFDSSESTVEVELNPLTISTLMIGHRESKLSLRDCLTALLEGLKNANDAFSTDVPAIASLKIIELYENRAIEALGILRQFADDNYFKDYLDISTDLKSLRGGQRRLDAAEESGWWRRLQITSEDDFEKQTSLLFTDISAGARAGQVIISNQENLIEPLLAEAMGESATKRDISKVLFELLIPPAFKPYAANNRPILLVVNSESARYPWELLHDKNADKPMAVRAHGIRQLIDVSVTYSPSPSNKRSALVIGDSLTDVESGFIELEGAQREAEVVGKLLQDARFDTKILIRKPAHEIATALFLNDVRILHIAAHGVVDYGPTKVTGAVLGSNVYFTASEAARLRPFPELVFLNCCHLGNMAPTTDEQKKLWNNRHHLAANLAEQFIRCGAKAVVAAGWAVNDKAASDFASVFYEGMTQGSTFADAVLAARKSVYARHPDCNTWGAYQCYGDPDYKLPIDQSSSTWRQAPPGTLMETLIDIDNTCAANETGSQRGRKNSEASVRALADRVPPQWRGDTQVQEGLGKAYADVLMFDEAIACYAAALAGSDALTRLKASEQLINLRVKNAYRKFKLPKEDSGHFTQAVAKAEILASVGQLESLVKMVDQASDPAHPAGKTVERLSIMAGAYKRLAAISKNAPQMAALKKAATYYQQAYILSKRTTRSLGGYYPGVNWQLLVALEGSGINIRVLDEIQKNADIEESLNPNFFAMVTAMDIMVVRSLGSQTIGTMTGEIITAFKSAWRRGGTYREGMAVKEQLQFISDILTAHKNASIVSIKTILAAVDDELQFAP